MDFDLGAFHQLEQMRGDRIYLVKPESAIQGDAKYGAEALTLLTKKRIPGYAINSKEAAGVAIQGQNSRYHTSYIAYLNVTKGFNPKELEANNYLMVNFEGLYEAKYIESVRHYGRVIYIVFELKETDASRELFSRNFYLLQENI